MNKTDKTRIKADENTSILNLLTENPFKAK